MLEHLSSDVIKSNGKLIPQAVKCWVERYEKNSIAALAELLTMLFEACGVQYQEEELLDDSSVDEVVLSLVNHAKSPSILAARYALSLLTAVGHG
ncbi:hypothetical protein ACLOJK_018063 [Asimina triloba]